VSAAAPIKCGAAKFVPAKKQIFAGFSEFRFVFQAGLQGHPFAWVGNEIALDNGACGA
jgi:hypothetical protein